MDALAQLRRLWAHAAWADTTLLAALQLAPNASAAWREYAHVLAAEALWLARLEQRPSPVAVWPTLIVSDAEVLQRTVNAGYRAYLDACDAQALERAVPYVNSAGEAFRTPAGDILLHVALHGQYHRGKVNLLLRQHGAVPAPVDYIAFVRGVPAATTSPPLPELPPRAV